MAHVRENIRSVLDNMGFSNQFDISDQSMLQYDKGGSLTVTIKDWEPHPDALKLKKKLLCCADGCINVNFELADQGYGYFTWKNSAGAH